MYYSPSSYLSLPTKPGVYLYLDGKGSILYVGKAKDLKARVSSYFVSSNQLGEKTKVLVSQIKKIKIVTVVSELEALLLEAYYIKKYTPRYNIKMTDGKSYPLIRIVLKENYPPILFARHPDDKNSVYFGPYPSSASVKTVLKLIRRVFPFVSVPRHLKRICLYHHLGLCPCPPIFASKKLQQEYRGNIKKIIKILEGESPKVLKELEKERDRASKKEDFEHAGLLQKQVASLQYITQPIHHPLEYDLNPNLRVDIRQKELTQLQKILIHSGYSIDQPIQKIECYDISHIQGTHTVASLVVFLNGEKESSLYRKFKIQLKKTPDDFASMREVFRRRLKHTEWEYPDLFIVDGGKGQVSAALEILNQMHCPIPLIGLAKRIETIVVPLEHPAIEQSEKGSAPFHKKQKQFLEVIIPQSVGAIKLIQRIRDEAHRFAITYHRTLRSKNTV